MAFAPTLKEFIRDAVTSLAALLPADAWACSVCVGWNEGQGLHAGFYVSALLLTALPFAVVAVIGVWLRAKVRRFEKGRADYEIRVLHPD